MAVIAHGDAPTPRLQGRDEGDHYLRGVCVIGVLHELGHALFHKYDIPLFGREEDAADQFAAYFMLQFDNKV